MAMADAFLAEFEQELEATQRIMGRIPADQLTWKPHEKSWTIGQLALHMAATPGQVVEMAIEDTFPASEFAGATEQPADLSGIIAALDKSIASVRKTLPTFTDESMGALWSAEHEGKSVLAMPRGVFLRAILFNHWYHHRGQLSVYLRLMNESVPSVYGSTADEVPDFMKDLIANAG